jgi:DNA-binding GntR family transcriptional regulator
MSRYRELRETLAREISVGVFPVGERFPTDFELCARFGVSRHTVREALRELQEQGILARQRGMGTIVRAQPGGVYTQTVGSLSELGSYAAETRLVRTSESVLMARSALADMLGCSVGRRWLHVSGVHLLDGHERPLCWTDIFIADDYLDLRKELREGTEPYYEKLRRARGVNVRDVEQRITAVNVPADTAAILMCEPGSPALLVRRRYFSDREEAFEVSLSLHPADRYAYTARLSRGNAMRESLESVSDGDET